jgi:protein TonB
MAKDRKPQPARKPDKTRSLRTPLTIAAVVAVLGAGVWMLSQNIAGVTKSAPPTPSVNLLPPPPPPPAPPPPTKEPPPPPENKPMEAPKPEDQPKPDNAPKTLTINGPAQAGGDAFGVGAGSGGGSTVGGTGNGGPAASGFEEAAYSRFVKGEIEQTLRSNSRIDRMFNTLDLLVWVAPDRRVHARIRRSTGNDKVDQELIATLGRMRPLSEPPPAQLKPMEITVKGVRG